MLKVYQKVQTHLVKLYIVINFVLLNQEYGGNCEFERNPSDCEAIQTHGSTVTALYQSHIHTRLFAHLKADSDEGTFSFDVAVESNQELADDDSELSTNTLTPVLSFASPSIMSDVWFDAISTHSTDTSRTGDNPRVSIDNPEEIQRASNSSLTLKRRISSAADLQVLLRSDDTRTASGLNRTPSSKSLSSLTGFKMTPMTASTPQRHSLRDHVSYTPEPSLPEDSASLQKTPTRKPEGKKSLISALRKSASSVVRYVYDKVVSTKTSIFLVAFLACILLVRRKQLF